MKLKTLVAAVTAAAIAAPAFAAEGMWTFDGFPIARANEFLGTKVDRKWLDHLQRSAVRIGGCSSSLVSGEGLILTNNHCVLGCTQKLSTREQDFVTRGFNPATRAEERQCPGATAEILMDISDVTQRVKDAAQGLSGKAFTQARDAAMGAIEKEACGDDKTQRCQVVNLYRGGQFKLYRFKRYTDVRLAFAPEHAAANFGGDPDNFNFPRYGLDFAFLRIYQDGKPLKTPTHLKWNASAPTAGQPVFVAGNAGSTQRLLTMSQLATQQSLVLPTDLMTRAEFRGRLLTFMAQNESNRFIGQDQLEGVENSFKRARGQLRALADAEFMGGRAKAEADLRAAVAARPALAAELGDPWADIDAVQDDYAELFAPYFFLESRAGGGSDLYGKARQLVRAAQERDKPAAERLPEYSDSRLPLIEKSLLDASPAHPELDALQLEWWLSKTREYLTPDAPQVRTLLGKDSPEALAARIAKGTRVGDAAFRKQLWEGGLAAVQASDDPLIRFILATDPAARAVRSQWEERVEGPTDRAAERLARARFEILGDSVYPDATGTLRLTYGRVEGWSQDGRTIGPFTTWAGLWDRATGQAPFLLANALNSARDRLNPATVLNMTLSTDTIGGSSGSPVVNARGEVIGANFDSTFLGQRNAFGYDIRVNRSVAVTTAAITEALDKAYGQSRLVRELTAK